jgi:nitrite reductase (NADH) small subunit
MDIGSVHDVPLEGARFITVNGVNIAVFKTSTGKIRALDNACAHKGGPLSEGIVHGEFVTCPLHNWVFSLKTGEAQGADKGCVKTYNVEVKNERIILIL